MLIAMLSFLIDSSATGQHHALLLGISYEEPISKALPYYAGSADSLTRAAYQTLLIQQRDSTFEISDADGIHIPRNNTFWTVGTKRSVYNDWVEDFVWSSGPGQDRKLSGIQAYNGEYCSGHRVQTIQYVDEMYLSLNQRTAGYCEGSSHPWLFNTLAVVPLDSTTHSGLLLSTVLGSSAYESMRERAQSFQAAQEGDSEQPSLFERVDEANWGFKRKEGKWLATARLDHLEEGTQPRHVDIDFEISLADTSSSVTPQLWGRVLEISPYVLDAFVAPSHEWLVLLRPGFLTVHKIHPDHIGKAVLARDVPPGTRAIMVKWGKESSLAHWIQHLNKLDTLANTQR